MDKIKQRIAELNKELLNLRRDFHKHPELGFEEHRTAGVVENYLKNLELHPQRMTKTGVVALLEGSKPHPVLMLRADMDALPVEEKNQVAYKSENKGVMHACGHDAHMAMLLVAAKILTENKDEIPGTIKFVFQPNEEIAGAVHMIADGVLENPTVDAVMGIHIWTPVASGKIAVTAGPVMAGLDVFKVTIHGKGGHDDQSAPPPKMKVASATGSYQAAASARPGGDNRSAAARPGGELHAGHDHRRGRPRRGRRGVAHRRQVQPLPARERGAAYQYLGREPGRGR